MINLRGVTPDTITCRNEKLNWFEGKTGDFVFTVRQPRKKHYKQHWRAWRKLSHQSKQNYKRKYEPDELYDNKYRCNLPLYHGEVPGWVPWIMMVDGEVVGFGDFMMKHGRDFLIHRLGDDEVGCSMNLCVLDKYQGMGIGSYYGHISLYMAKHLGADYALGYTQYRGGMFTIRMRDNWEHVGRRGGWAVIQKCLK